MSALKPDSLLNYVVVKPSQSNKSGICYNKVAIVIFIIAIIVVVLWFMTVENTSVNQQLYNNGWRLFVSSTCGFCHKQLKALGGSYPDMVVCDKMGGCQGIRAFPTWYNVKTDQLHEGFVQPNQLL